MNTEDKAFNWLLKSGYSRQSIIRRTIYNPDFETVEGRGFEAKTCYGAKYFKHRREESGTLIISSLKQWRELYSHPNCQIIVFGEGKEPLAIIPMSELPLGTKRWNDIKIRVMVEKNQSLKVPVK